MTNSWKNVLVDFLELAPDRKQFWLIKLSFFISMFARGTYEVGSEQVERPEQLRKFNELLHRISSFQLEIALNKKNKIPDDQFFLMLSDAIAELKINELTLIEQIKNID